MEKFMRVREGEQTLVFRLKGLRDATKDVLMNHYDNLKSIAQSTAHAEQLKNDHRKLAADTMHSLKKVNIAENKQRIRMHDKGMLNALYTIDPLQYNSLKLTKSATRAFNMKMRAALNQLSREARDLLKEQTAASRTFPTNQMHCRQSKGLYTRS